MRVVILLALLGSALAVPMSINRIVGGSPTTVEQYPYMCNMQYVQWSIFWLQGCGGTLLTKTSVLSAAHCYQEGVPAHWRVLLGTSRATSNDGSLHAVSQLVPHSGYIPSTIVHNLAIVRLATPAVYSPSIQPARIPGSSYSIADGTTLTAIGWGASSSLGASFEQLQHVDINLINQKVCADRYAYLKTQPGFQNGPDITDNMMCTGLLDVGGKDFCYGDEGGPLAHLGDIIVGVLSWGRCGSAVNPSISVRVSKYTEWIVANA